MSQASSFPDCLIVQKERSPKYVILVSGSKIFFLVTVTEKNKSLLEKNEIPSYMHSESDLITKMCLYYDKIP